MSNNHRSGQNANMSIIDDECGHVESTKSADMSNNHEIPRFKRIQYSSARDDPKFVYLLLSDLFPLK